MSDLSPLRLMQLHDGELDADLEAALLAELELVADSDHGACEASAQLAGLEQLGDFLRSTAEQQPTHFTSLADQVMAALDPPALKLVPGPDHADLNSASGGSSEKAPAPDLTASKPERGWVLGAAAFVAAAAAGLLWMQLSSRPADAPQAVATSLQKAEQAVPSGALAPEQASLSAEAPVAIVSVDFGGNDGTIFVVGEESTPVVWLVDELPVKKTKMGPL